MATNPNTAEPAKPRRRWFQFRLRTLLVGIVMLSIPCAYIAHEASIVRARQLWIDAQAPLIFPSRGTCRALTNYDPNLSPGPLRQWLGDVEWSAFTIAKGTTAGEEREIERLFPETAIYRFRGDYP